MRRRTVVVVSHDPSVCEPLTSCLRSLNSWPVLLSDVPAAASAIGDCAYMALLILHGPLSYCQPLLDLLANARADRPPFVIVSVDGSENFAVAALHAGASDYFPSPLDLASFSDSVSRWLPASAPIEANDGLTGGEVLVGNSPIMHAVRMNIRRVAATDCNVLITGETGTGKELVAELIHQNSSRSKNPFISINCAAIPDPLLESELFGYERGAFTGAHASSPGKLMTAHKGTVFFDEIGDMSPCAQAKILRAIEVKEVQRLGATRRYETDIRILAATHHDLDDLSSTPSFRRDLYFRLNVGRIHLSPLRERKADIACLVDRMVHDLNRKLGSHIEGASAGALERLAQYDWPGNVRELKNVIERVFINRQNGMITADDLPYPAVASRSLPAPIASETELCCLRDALTSCNGNKSKAAERLNWSRMTLYRKMAKYGMGETTSNAKKRTGSDNFGATCKAG
jgi:DNA-binding NtrC family response regulator